MTSTSIREGATHQQTRPKLHTDQSGTATLGVQGFGQKEEMPKDANRVEKRAAMRIPVQVIAAVKTAMELLYRTRWLSPYRFEFHVRDWAQPDGKSNGGQVPADGKSYDMNCSGRLETSPGVTTTWEQTGTLTLSE